MTQRGGIAGCYDLDQVDVCWFPYTANGNTGLCLDYQGNYPFATFAKGDGVCVQSVNQTVKAPNCTRNLGARGAQSGYTWVYKNATGETGWVLTSAITSAAGNAGCCGPALLDYQCGSGNASKCSSAPCDGQQSYSPTVASVSGNRQINGPDGYVSLRLGPGSTALYYLPNNACVTQRLTIGNDSLWTCVARRVRVTFKLSATAKRDTKASFLAAPCTKGGCIDTGSRSGHAFALGQEPATIVRTMTLRRASNGAIVCVTAFAYDLGPDGENIRGTIGQLKVCPHL